MLKPWEKLENRCYYCTETEELRTSYQLYIDFENFKDDEALECYNGNFYEWIDTMIIFDVLRPVGACIAVLVPYYGKQCMLFVEAYETEDDARAAWKANNYVYDDFFAAGPLPSIVVNFETCPDDALEWLTDPANNYTSQCWESALYGDVPEDVYN